MTYNYPECVQVLNIVNLSLRKTKTCRAENKTTDLAGLGPKSLFGRGNILRLKMEFTQEEQFKRPTIWTQDAILRQSVF